MSDADEEDSELFESSKVEAMRQELEQLSKSVASLEQKWATMNVSEKKLVSQSGGALLKKQKLDDLSQTSLAEIISQLLDVFRNPQVERAKDFVRKILHETKAKLRQSTKEDILRGITKTEEENLAKLTNTLEEIESGLGERDKSMKRAFGKLIEEKPLILLDKRDLEDEWSRLSNLDDAVNAVLTVWSKHGFLPEDVLEDVSRSPKFYSDDRSEGKIKELDSRSDDLIRGLASIKTVSGGLFTKSSKRVEASLTKKHKTLHNLLKGVDSATSEILSIEGFLASLRSVAKYLDKHAKGKGRTSGSSRLDDLTKGMMKRIRNTKGLKSLARAVQDFHADFEVFAEHLDNEFSDLHSRVEDSLDTFKEEQEVQKIRSRGIPTYEPGLFREDTLKAIERLNRLRKILNELESILLEKWSPSTVEVYQDIQKNEEIPYDPEKTTELGEISSTIPLILRRKGT